MIKQYVLTIEAESEEMIDMFIRLVNKQVGNLGDVSPIKMQIEEK